MKKVLTFISVCITLSLDAQTGRIGINTANPQATLHINGTVRIDSVPSSDTISKFLVLDNDGVVSFKETVEIVPKIFTCGDVFIDPRDGEQYPTTQIGAQCWMAKNLNYRTSSGSWYYLGDSASYAHIYGRMYQWATMTDGAPDNNSVPGEVQGLCPSGWHMPSFEEWNILIFYGAGGQGNGGYLKEAEFATWNSPNTGATNYTRFRARAGGHASGGPTQSTGIGDFVEFWTTLENSSSVGWCWRLDKGGASIWSLTRPKTYGLYCRCIKDYY